MLGIRTRSQLTVAARLVRLLIMCSCCICATALTPGQLFAQTPAAATPATQRGDLGTVYVHERGGTEIKGRLLELSPQSLRLLVGTDERTIELSQVSRIQKRDGLKNGLLIGAMVGVAMGALTAGISDCPNPNPGGHCAGVRAGTFVTAVAVYAAVGAGIDAFIPGRRTIYLDTAR